MEHSSDCRVVIVQRSQTFSLFHEQPLARMDLIK
jgi:hypothetical protein